MRLDLILRAREILTMDPARPTATAIGVIAGRIVVAPKLTSGPSTALGIGALITLVVSVTLLGADLTWAIVAVAMAAGLVTAQALLRRRPTRDS